MSEAMGNVVEAFHEDQFPTSMPTWRLAALAALFDASERSSKNASRLATVLSDRLETPRTGIASDF